MDSLRSFDRAKGSAIGLGIMRPRTPARIGQRLARIYDYRRGGPRPKATGFIDCQSSF